MKIPRRTFGFIVGVLVTLGGVLLVSLLVRDEYLSRQTVTRAFTIDEDFTDVRKILVRNDGAKEIVKMGGGSDFLAQEWESVGLDADQPLDQLLDPDWRINLHGTLRVRTKDEYVGEHEIALAQDVEIEPDFLHSEVRLKEPTERLKEYNMETKFDRDTQSGRARVNLELTQAILTDVPWFAYGIADRRVRQSAERTLANQEAAIRQLIAENIDDVPVFPLR